MASRQPMQPKRALMARLYAACRPAMDMRTAETGDYLIETPDNRVKGSTLGSSINYDPQQA